MTKLFRDAFIEALDRSGWSVAYVAKVAGVSAQQLHKLKQGKALSTNVDDALRVAHVFGVSLDEFLEDRTVQDREAVADLWRQLSDAERDLLRAAAAGRDALKDRKD